MKVPIKEKEYYGSSEFTVPKQIKRAFPALIAIVVFIIFISGFSTPTDLTGKFEHKDPHFPKKIWQTWKVDPLGFEEKDSTLARTWIQKNPNFRYEVLTDENDMAYVETNFGPDGVNRPDIVYIYRELTAKIIKADLLRYMVMYIEGGIYTDIDVEALRPIHRFIPERFDEKDIEMIVGVEIDQPEFSWHPILGTKCQSFVQWTFMCKPHLPVMLTLIENIIAWLNEVAREQRVPIGELTLDFDQVISGTGPSAFTKAILENVSKRINRQVTWDTFHGMAESKLIGPLLVLTVEAFAAGQGHSDSGNHEAKQALVRHHYHASGWPTTHPRYNHPMYGEVERCNWDMDCVLQWDEDVSHWDELSDEERDRELAIKEAQDAQDQAAQEAKDAADAEEEAQAEARAELRAQREAEARAAAESRYWSEHGYDVEEESN